MLPYLTKGSHVKSIKLKKISSPRVHNLTKFKTHNNPIKNFCSVALGQNLKPQGPTKYSLQKSTRFQALKAEAPSVGKQWFSYYHPHIRTTSPRAPKPALDTSKRVLAKTSGINGRLLKREEITKDEVSLSVKEKTFHDLKLNDTIVKTLNDFKIVRPSQIQLMAAHHIAEGRDVVLASSTGSGKTYAYLLPIIQNLINLRDQPDFRRKGQRMSCIVLVPSRELVYQVWQFAENAMKDMEEPLRVYGFSPFSKKKREMTDIHQHVDILVSTPERFLFHLNTEHLYLDQVRFLVIDEADSLLAEPMDQEMSKVIKALKARIQGKAHATQLVFTSATLTQAITKFIDQYFTPKFGKKPKYLVSDDLHEMLQNIKQNFIYCPTEGEKKTKFLDLVSPIMTNHERMIVFCNTLETVNLATKWLLERRFNFLNITSEDQKIERRTKYLDFVNHRSKLLVTTDIYSRGLDFPNVKHVVSFDFPNTAIGYLHRIGRTGRFKKKGYAHSFYDDATKNLVFSIQDTMLKENSLAYVKPLKPVEAPTAPEPKRKVNKKIFSKFFQE